MDFWCGERGILGVCGVNLAGEFSAWRRFGVWRDCVVGLNFNFGFLAFWCFKFLADFGVRILGACGANLVGEFWRTLGRKARRVGRGF